MQETFTLEEIKSAFWKTFRGCGELWFPYEKLSYSSAEIDGAVEQQWGDFLENLKPRSSEASQATLGSPEDYRRASPKKEAQYTKGEPGAPRKPSLS